MTTVAISALPAVVAPTTADLFPVVQGGTTKKLTLSLAFSIPPPIGATTPNTGAFSSLSATGALSVGATATVNRLISSTTVVLLSLSGPSISAGTGVPATTTPKGSIFLRTDGGVGSTLYVSQGSGTWNPVAGV